MRRWIILLLSIFFLLLLLLLLDVDALVRISFFSLRHRRLLLLFVFLDRL